MSFKILFMGTPDFAVPILKSIFHSKHKILEVYTQPPKKQSRGQKIQNSPIHKISEKFNISVRCPVSLNTKEELDHLKDLRPDIAIVVAYGKIIPANFLNLENISFINIHASLLPKWRELRQFKDNYEHGPRNWSFYNENYTKIRWDRF